MLPDFLTPTFVQILILITRHYGSEEKALQWLQCPNLNLDSQTPLEMCMYNREKMLLKWVKENMNET